MESNFKQNKNGIGVDEIRTDIEMSRLRWLGHVMWMEEERIPKKMLHTKMDGK